MPRLGVGRLFSITLASGLMHSDFCESHIGCFDAVFSPSFQMNFSSTTTCPEQAVVEWAGDPILAT